MDASEPRLDFFYEGGRVGYFAESSYPTESGRYRYMPYRSGSYLKMQTALETGMQPRCTYRHGERIVSFDVVGCPDYGMLDLASFSDVLVAGA